MHYVCTGGCQGVAQQSGSCQAESCKDFHKDLRACSCEDGKHTEVFAASKAPTTDTLA